MHSAIYTGVLQHCRHQPKHHFFQYKVFMLYLDLEEIEEVFAQSRFWSFKKPALAWLRRQDFIGANEGTITEAVKQAIRQQCGKSFHGRIRMLANMRYFGWQMNPIVCYYCFNTDQQLEYVVAEVTNTPWREKQVYVLSCDTNKPVQKIHFAKQMHVSPFNDLNFTYEWIGGAPAEELSMRLVNWREGKHWFNANLKLQREAISTSTLNKVLIKYPLMTLKVFAGIYWQALRLYLKGVPFVSHPNKSKAAISTYSLKENSLKNTTNR